MRLVPAMGCAYNSEQACHVDQRGVAIASGSALALRRGLQLPVELVAVAVVAYQGTATNPECTVVEATPIM